MALVAVCGCLSVLGCAGGVDRLAATNEYAISAAQQGLWKEAVYRWEQAIEIDDGDARVWNNVAVAYEANGRLEDAIGAYRKGLTLDPGNDELARNLLRAQGRQLRSTPPPEPSTGTPFDDE